jgi:hypothetical protein
VGFRGQEWRIENGPVHSTGGDTLSESGERRDQFGLVGIFGMSHARNDS